MMYKSRREECELLRMQLEQERQSFLPHWRDLGDYILPRRPRFNTNDVNKGDRRNQKIIDSTATLALRTLRSGMMAGITSPARPWFRLGTPDPGMMEIGRVKDWLQVVTQRMSTVFLRSNLYNCLPILYGDLGVFATSALGIEEDINHVVRFTPFPIGSYAISNDERLRVSGFTREFKMTVRQLINKFGRRNVSNGKLDFSNFSTYVKDQYDQNNLEAWVDVVHVIYPNREHNPKKLDAKYKKFASIYYEKSGTGDTKSRYKSSAIEILTS